MPSLLSVPSIMPALHAVPVTIAGAVAVTPIMKNDPKISAAKPSLDAMTAAMAKFPSNAAEALNVGFDASLAPHICAACADDSIPSAAPSAQAAPLTPAAGRLPKTVAPRSYDLKLTLDPENSAFTGRVKISIDSKKPATQLTIHALDLTFNAVTVAGRRLDPSKIVVDAKAETVTFLLDAPLKGRADVEIEYSGKMNELMRGLFKARGKNGDKDEAWSFTHLEPTHARRVVPSFDEPAFKATFKLTLEVPAGLTPISNMPKESETVTGDRKTVVFHETPKMSSYLLAVFAARLEARTRKVGKTTLTVWAAPDQIAQADFALDAGVHALTFLNKYFGIPYMLPKLDMVASPDFASGAMENWGAILFRDSSLLIDPKLSSDAAKRRVAEVVSHEIVHQWFGDLVTMGWWNDLWLNEAFATWLAYKIVDAWKPAWKVWDEFGQSKRSPMSIDALPGTRPVRSEASTPAEIQAQFDPMAYDKGGALLRMIETYIGEADFRKGIQAYMKKFAYKNAEAKDLARELERASGKPVSKMMDGWLTQGGVPVVSLTAEGRTLTLTQSRFSAFNLKADTKWAIPVVIRYKLKGETKTRIYKTLLETATARVTLPGNGDVDWIYPNAGEIGYYRFKLDTRLLLAALARRGDLTPIERAGLLNNLWAQVRAGQMPVASFLDHLAAFRGDASRLIVEDAFGYLKTIRQELSENDAQRDAIGVYASELFLPLSKKLGWDKKKGESQETTLTRPTVLNALALLAPKALDQEQVLARLKKYLADPSSIDSSVSAVILTAAARRNDPALFAEFRARLAFPKTPEQKNLMLRALAEFSEPSLADQYLGMTLSKEIRPQDAWMPYAWLLSNPATRERSWAFVKANWKELSAKVGPRGGTRVVGAAGGLVSVPWKEEVGSFFRAPENEIEMARKTLDQTLESIDLGLRFKDGQAQSFHEWAGLSAGVGRLSAPGFKAFERMTAIWSLTAVQKRTLLGVDARTYVKYKKDPSTLSRASLERVSLTLGVYGRLRGLFGNEMADTWIKRPNKAFGGKPALEVMLRDAAGLREVRDYLSGVGGGWL
jgi:puromycin-sensitive aminopeptidase